MKTFTGSYFNRNFVLSDDNEVLKANLVSILNTPIGSRFYYPSYGSNLSSYKGANINYFTINMIGQEIKSAIDLIDGVELSNFSYYFDDENVLRFNITLSKRSQSFIVNLAIKDGFAS